MDAGLLPFQAPPGLPAIRRQTVPGPLATAEVLTADTVALDGDRLGLPEAAILPSGLAGPRVPRAGTDLSAALVYS